jgi:hypothetical protein
MHLRWWPEQNGRNQGGVASKLKIQGGQRVANESRLTSEIS